MAILVPTSTQWITFPINPKASVPVEWYEGRIACSNNYYITQCYWGVVPNLKGPEGARIVSGPAIEIKGEAGGASAKGLITTLAKHGISLDAKKLPPGQEPAPPKPRTASSNDKELKVMGKTKLYIAAEFIEEQYCDGIMSNYHIRNLAKTANVEGWITMQLDECFHYGQSGGDGILDRWIVYHPSLVWNKPAPRIFQHRFSGIVAATAARSAKSATDSFEKVAPDGMKQAGLAGVTAASIGIDILRSVAGHYLHPFLNHHERGVALYLRTSIKVGRAGDLDNEFKEVAKEGTESYDAQLIAYQVVEALLSERENKKSEKDANLKDRLIEMLQYHQSLYGGLRPAWVDKAVAYIRGSSTGEDDAAAAADETIKGLTIQSIPASDADDAANSSLLDGVTPAAANPTRKKEPEKRKSTGFYLILPGLPPRPPPLEKLEDWLKPPPQLEDWLKPPTSDAATGPAPASGQVQEPPKEGGIFGDFGRNLMGYGGALLNPDMYRNMPRRGGRPQS